MDFVRKLSQRSPEVNALLRESSPWHIRHSLWISGVITLVILFSLIFIPVPQYKSIPLFVSENKNKSGIPVDEYFFELDQQLKINTKQKVRIKIHNTKLPEEWEITRFDKELNRFYITPFRRPGAFKRKVTDNNNNRPRKVGYAELLVKNKSLGKDFFSILFLKRRQ